MIKFDSIRKRKPLECSDQFPLGKYMGIPVQFVVENDFQYILWAHNKLIFEFTPLVLQKAKEMESIEFKREFYSMLNMCDILEEDVPY